MFPTGLPAMLIHMATSPTDTHQTLTFQTTDTLEQNKWLTEIADPPFIIFLETPECPDAAPEPAQGSECGLQVLPLRSAAVAAGTQATLALSALRAGAFKSRKWFIFGIGDGAANSGTNVRFEVESVTVQGIPQFISTAQDAANGFVALSDSFLKPDEPVPVSFMVFGSDPGQQMQVTVRNIGNIAARCYITLWGDAAEVSAVGTY